MFLSLFDWRLFAPGRRRRRFRKGLTRPWLRSRFSGPLPARGSRGGLTTAAAALRESGERDGDDQRRAVEQGLDEEGAAEQLNAGDADGEDENAEYAAQTLTRPA